MNSQYKFKKITSSNQNINATDTNDLSQQLINQIKSKKSSYFVIREDKKNNNKITKDNNHAEYTYLQIHKLSPASFERNEWYENNKTVLREKSKARYLDSKDVSYFSDRVEFSQFKTHNIHKMIGFIEYNLEFFLEISSRDANDINIKTVYDDLKQSTHQKALNNFLQALTFGLKNGNRELMLDVLDQNLALRRTLKIYMENYHASPIKRWYQDTYPDKDISIKWLSSCKNKEVTFPLRLKIFGLYRSQLSPAKKIASVYQAFIDLYWELREKSFLEISKTADEFENIINNKMLYFVPHHVDGHKKPVIDEQKASELLNYKNLEDYRLQLPLVYVTQQFDLLLARIKAKGDDAKQNEIDLEELKQKIEKICEDKLFLYYQDPINQCVAIKMTLENACKRAKDKAHQSNHLPSFLSFFPNLRQNVIVDALEQFNNKVIGPLVQDLELNKQYKY